MPRDATNKPMSVEIPADPVNPVAAVSPGAVLAAARVAQGFTVENVAGRLKLASYQIQAMESDDFGALPGAVFARGFVKNYARLLKLDTEPLIAAMALLEAPAPRQDVRLLPDAKSNNGLKGAALEPARHRRLFVSAMVVACVVGILAYYEFGSHDSSVPVLARQAPEALAPPPSVHLPAALPPAAVPPVLQDEVATSAAPVADGIRGLHFLFSKESWVEVQDRLGNILISKVNLQGTEHRVQGEPPFKVVVGRAHGVQLAYNGKPVDLAAHATEDVARLRLE